MSTERKMVMGWVKVVVAPDIFASRVDDVLQDREKKYLSALQRSGEIMVIGPLADGTAGLVVYDVQSLKEAEELVERQPMVRAGLLSVELHEMFAVTYG
ncbi:MAG: YciI family protein [Gemmatimonadales bacterium]